MTRARSISRIVLIAGGCLFALALLASALVIGYVASQRAQTVVLPAPTGPFTVGRTAFDWTDEARQDPLNPTGNARREVLVWVWYPAEPSSGAAPAAYVPEPWEDLLAQQHGLGDVLFQNLDAVRGHAFADAPVAAAQPAYPVLVLMPGFGSIPADYTSLAEDLASRGYVVAGVTPTGSAPVVVFPDGRLSLRTSAGSLPEDADAAALKRSADTLVAVWAADARFVLDRLTALDGEPGGQFAGKLELSRVGFLGHSFGGATAAEVCRQDDRCRAGADLDGTLFGPVAERGLTQPFLFVGSDETAPCDVGCRESRAAQQRVFERLPDGYQLTVAGTRHFNFGDSAVLFAPVVRAMGLLGPIDGRRGLEITATYVGAFFDHYLLGKEASLLAGPSPVYPEVRITRR